MANMISAVKNKLGHTYPAMQMDSHIFQTQVRGGLVIERLLAALSGFFGALATALATVGLYGVISYIVIRRRNEMGIRAALGASRGQIVGMVMKEAGLLLLAGGVIGIALSLAAGRGGLGTRGGRAARDRPIAGRRQVRCTARVRQRDIG